MRVPLLAMIAAAALSAGCSAAADDGPRFDDEGAAALTCMKHQPAGPGPRYTDAARRSTTDALPLLRYYTANGAKGFCDGAAPTETDRTWARVYVDLGADRANVVHILDDGPT